MDVRKSRKWIGDKRMVGFVEDFFDDFNLFHDKKKRKLSRFVPRKSGKNLIPSVIKLR